MIFQINGIDVHSRDQAIKLFSERTSDIFLRQIYSKVSVGIMLLPQNKELFQEKGVKFPYPRN
jgi:hypothetical protein